ncbi:MAG: XRE family transcriptional regulator [Pseudomonadota bacterium]
MRAEFDIAAMRARLAEALKDSGISMRKASLNAGLGHGYVHSILNEGKEPTVQQLAKICSENDISLVHVLFGFEISPETEELMKLISSDPAKRDAILALLPTPPADQPRG